MSKLWSLRMLTVCWLLWAGIVSAENSDPQQQLHQLYDEVWSYRLQEFPQMATWSGVADYNDRLASVAEADQQRRYQYWQQALQRLEAIPADGLSDEELINRAIFQRQLQSLISDYRYGAYLIPMSSDEGFHTALARLPRIMPFATLDDYQNYLSRLGQIEQVFGQYQALMSEGLRRGITLPQVVLQGRDEAFRGHIVEQPQDSVYYQPFRQRPASIDAGQWQQLQQQAQTLIEQEIVPAYRRFSDFFSQQYVPGARATTAAGDLPQGAEYYRDRVRHFTTLEITPKAVHQLGLEEVARIRAEMQQIIDELEFDGDFAAFLAFLRSDPQFYAKTAEELLMHAAWIGKRMEAQLPQLFGRLPRQPYGIAPVPAELAPHYTGGRYAPAPEGSTQPGYYWVNTYQLENRPLYVLPALTLHEAVPGHHLQNALAAEQGEQPAFRRNDYISAYGEGWGLYAEYLGVEAGIYRTPYEHFGRLTYEMWRACRLVIDTGLHAFGWSRQQALDYLASHTALSLHEVTTEVDRYIAWPGQALSYKMGELTIKRLRREAEQALGGAFDLRAFHDLILAQGSVPLPILESQVAQFIASQQTADQKS